MKESVKEIEPRFPMFKLRYRQPPAPMIATHTITGQNCVYKLQVHVQICKGESYWSVVFFPTKRRFKHCTISVTMHTKTLAIKIVNTPMAIDKTIIIIMVHVLFVSC